MHNITKNLRSLLLFIGFAYLLAACSFFEKDNTPVPKPLTNFRSEIYPKRLWSTNTGPIAGDEYLKMGPVIGPSAIFTASANGIVTSVNKRTGHVNWRKDTHLAISTGPGVGDGIVVVGSRRGHIAALRQTDGHLLWTANLAGEILAEPAVGQGIVVIKAVDGYLRALSASDGHTLWSFRQVEPNLILRGSSAPVIRGNEVIVGFANGNLSKLNLHDGQILWQHAIAIPEGAFAIQRMIDIDANPIVYEHHLYAATYQGKISSLDWLTGNVLWSHDISSYTGMIADNNTVFVSDAKSYVWAFGADNGLVNWRQTQLEARVISAPASMRNYVVLGDAQGYLHWLSKADGHFAGRVSVGSGIYAAPVVENNILYALTNNGNLIAYTLS